MREIYKFKWTGSAVPVPATPAANGGGWAGLQRGRTGTHGDRTRPIVQTSQKKTLSLFCLSPVDTPAEVNFERHTEGVDFFHLFFDQSLHDFLFFIQNFKNQFIMDLKNHL